MTQNYITVTEFKNANPDVDLSNFPDTTISGIITTGSAWIDNYLNYSLSAEDIVDELNEVTISSKGNLNVFTRKIPIISVAAISLKVGTVHLDLNLVDGAGNARYDIAGRGKYVMYPYQEIAMTGTFSLRNFYQMRDLELFSKISYRAGYETIPNDIKHACSLFVRDFIVRNPGSFTSMQQGGITLSYGQADDQGDTMLLNQARQMLASYRKMWS